MLQKFDTSSKKKKIKMIKKNKFYNKKQQKNSEKDFGNIK